MRDVLQNSSPNPPPFRLPDAVRPVHYDVEVKPDLAGNTFKGRVVVELHVDRPTRYIVFHALGLDIAHASVTSASREYGVGSVQYTPENEIALVQLDESLTRDSTATLELGYAGQMAAPGSMSGLYLTPYQAPGGGVKSGFETMLAPTMARRVFPCWDEPDIKAQFTISIVTGAELTCLSNMQVKSESPACAASGEPMKKVLFNTTPKMSTYLVVLIAGYFNFVESNDFHVPIRVWAPLDMDISSASYALDIASKALKAHENNFGLEYPLPKLDMVAIPGHQGGMEHWGCVSYSYKSLLLGKHASELEKLQVAYLVTHELAHQWFGNIVTMKWWDSLWLNEAFAEWATVHTLSQMLPDWDAWDDFVAAGPERTFTGGYQSALDLDSNAHSHAILDPNIPPSAAFDSITYLKGCCIIRMMAEDLGVSVFLAGIRHYLKQHLYGNATTDELWDALTVISGQDVAGTMDAWTNTVGYPLLTVNELRPTRELVVTQSRFLQNGNGDTQSGPYPISVHLHSQDGIVRREMRGKRTTFPASFFQYKLNYGQTGFYRVSYPLSRVHKFAIQFSQAFLSTKDKIGIISDLGALVATGSPSRRVRLSDLLDFFFSVKDQVEDLFVWREILAQLRKIRSAFLFEGHQVLEILKLARLKLLAHVVEKTSLEFTPKDTVKQTLMKALLFSEFGDHPVVQRKAREAWNRLLGGDKDAIDPNIRQPIFDSVVSLDSTDKTWLQLKSIVFEKQYIRSTEPMTPTDALRSLGSTRNPDLITKALEVITPSESALGLSILSANLTQTTTPFVMNWFARTNVLHALSEHAAGAEASWAWVVNNWDLLKSSQGKGGIGSMAFLETASKGLATREHLKHAEAFFANKMDKASNPNPSIMIRSENFTWTNSWQSTELMIRQIMDRIRAKARFANADRGDLLEWAEQTGLKTGCDDANDSLPSVSV